MSSSAVILLLMAAVVFLMASIKRIQKDERLIYFKAGKPTTLQGPGVVLALPGIHKTRRLSVNANTTSLPEMRFEVGNRPLLVTGIYTWKIADPLKAASVPDLKSRIERQLESTFGEILLNATLKDCLCDSFTVENVAEDLINEQTLLFGVKVSKLECKSFPAHRQLALQLAVMITAPIGQLEKLTQQIAGEL